jgi:hypothetical protein
MLMSPAARGAANTTLTTLAMVTAVKGLVDLRVHTQTGFYNTQPRNANTNMSHHRRLQMLQRLQKLLAGSHTQPVWAGNGRHILV